MESIDVIWERIRRNVGRAFKTVTGLPFTYEVPGNYLRTSRTVRHMSRTNFQKALELMPCGGLAAVVWMNGGGGHGRRSAGTR